MNSQQQAADARAPYARVLERIDRELRELIEQADTVTELDTMYWEYTATGQDTEEAENSGALAGQLAGLQAALDVFRRATGIDRIAAPEAHLDLSRPGTDSATGDLDAGFASYVCHHYPDTAERLSIEPPGGPYPDPDDEPDDTPPAPTVTVSPAMQAYAEQLAAENRAAANPPGWPAPAVCGPASRPETPAGWPVSASNLPPTPPAQDPEDEHRRECFHLTWDAYRVLSGGEELLLGGYTLDDAVTAIVHEYESRGYTQLQACQIAATALYAAEQHGMREEQTA